MLLNDLVTVSRDVAATRSRLRKRALLAGCLRAAGPDRVRIVVDYLGGNLPQGRIGLGPAILRKLDGGGASSPSLSIGEVHADFAVIAGITGKGSQAARRQRLGALFGRCTPDEHRFLVRLILGELRQGALEAVLVEAIAEATGIADDEVRRAVMLAGEAASVAEAAMAEGHAGLARFRLTPLSPVRPMLAQPAQTMADAIAALGEAALEDKLDGARVQIHRVGQDVRIFTRRLNDVTASMPEIVEATLALPAQSLILDGEVIALRDDGRPQPFQITMRRFGRKVDVEAMRTQIPLDVFFFDVLYHDGEALIDRPAADRYAVMAAALPPELVVRRQVTDRPGAAHEFLRAALAAGHEGIMAKSLDAPYAAGNRGLEWLKVKQAHTLDLVVLAAEWGSGRREGWLSNLHLGARDGDGHFVMLGKTFKGLTDKMLAWQTKKLLELEIGREEHVVHVRPELVVEIAVNEIQASPHYPAGMALRFARVKRYRDDKRPTDADTIDTVRDIFVGQGGVGQGGAA